MVQGTTSDAGKSILTAGLCRLLARRGVSVAPFKPQNMALNSAVTVDGGEIGRSQAVQAQACYLEPHTDMNPVLLKPSSDIGAQVIIQGQAVDSMQATQFHDYKKVAMNAVLESHQRLCQQYQRLIVEGAGSPAEINLRQNDIANMGFAEAVDCPVIIVADIDRGGVFAHLVGTLDLLSPSEQQRVVGFVINRFRGDIKLLEPGLEWLEQRTHKPVLAVLPYLPDFYLDAEDAINASQRTKQHKETDTLRIVVPVFSRISNHTDFDALRLHPAVDLQFVSLNDEHPHQADLIILPGSKNVRQDLALLKQAGWTERLHKHLRYGGKILGICGGYQMLGTHIDDPQGIEGKAGQSTGLGLLAAHTTLMPSKQLRQVNGHIIADGFDNTEISGYEIHCGVTETTQTLDQQKTQNPFIKINKNKKLDGLVNSDNNVAGTYFHGLFDQTNACDAILKWAGLTTQATQAVNLNQHREQQLDRLADCLEQHFDSGFLTQLTGHEASG